MIRNAHWYTRNEGTPYPVDDAATGSDDNGTFLPSNIIADINLRWPSSIGEYAFISAVSVTPGIVSVVILAATAIDDPGEITPLAVVSVRQPVQKHRLYALEGQLDGVGGWIAFGSGASDRSYLGRFSSPLQSRLTSRAARPYRPTPVTSLRSDGANVGLTGVVQLRADEPLTIVQEARTIDGVSRDCFVIQLTAEGDVDGTTVPAEAQRILGTDVTSVFREFAGPCGGRPESRSCGDPEPIEFLNGVAPDCDGLITIEFTGCANITHIIDGCGIAIDCNLSADDICLPDGTTMPDIEPPNIPTITPDTEDPVSLSQGADDCLPYLNCFHTEHDLDAFTIVSGLWEWSSDDGPTVICENTGDTQIYYDEQSISSLYSISESTSQELLAGSFATATPSRRCLATWEECPDNYTSFRVLETEFKILAGPDGALHNAGIAINYRVVNNVGRYVLVEADYDAQELRIGTFNGVNYTYQASIVVPWIELDTWYRLRVYVYGGISNTAQIEARIYSAVVPDSYSSIAHNVQNFGPDHGRFGLTANRCLARFSYFSVEPLV